jgi:prenyltransferase beta subunit
MHRLAIAALALAAALIPAAAASAATPASYLRSAQNADGGFGMTPGSGSSQFATGWALLGLAARGQDPERVRRAGGRPGIAYVRAGIGSIQTIGDVERTILVVRAAGLNPRRFGGRNLVAEVLRRRRADGSIAGQVSYTSFGIMALRAAGMGKRSARMRAAVRWLARQQNGDGGFNVGGRGGSSGIDDTGYAVQALVAGGRRGTRAVRRAAGFLARARNADGGFPVLPGASSNAQSTAYAVQALVAAGGRGAALRDGTRYLRSLIQPNGLVRFSRTSTTTPVWVTAQAALALARKPFPLAPVR